MTTPPFNVVETDHLWIEMADGARLAARLWRPDTDQPVPAILEYIPYRKTDMVRARDEQNHLFFAAHGYACIRVDMRGSGDSDGDMPDMYAPAELDDARQVIHWLAAQPWCSGRVGMFGTSWGGTASLQASVEAPEPLKAVIAVCATHDRFEDDIHYMGGCVLTDTFEWGATLPAILASPLTRNTGADWIDRWRARIENLTCPLDSWLRKKGRGAYWRHGSVIHQADRLNVPILAVGGWSDRYSNSVMQLVDARPDLVWGVVGPWGHHYPDRGSPGPGIGFQRLALDWWDHHLKPNRTDSLNWPRMRCWLRAFDEPENWLDQRSGRWIESGPPAQEADWVEFPLDGLETPSAAPWTVPRDPQVGVMSGDTGYFGRPGGLPLDQSPDDARSLTFETRAFEADMVLFGAPVLKLRGSASERAGQIVVRVSEVDPGGKACRISYGVRNMALDDRLDIPDKPQPDDGFDLSIPLHTIAYRLRKGHRLRISISSALWPLIWSAGDKGAFRISSGDLMLPVLPGGGRGLQAVLPEVEDLPAEKSYVVLSAPALERWSGPSGNGWEIGWRQPMTRVSYIQTETVFGYETRMVHRQDLAHHHTESTDFHHVMEFQRPDGKARVETALTARCSDGAGTARITLNATWNGSKIGHRAWDIPFALSV